MAEQSNLFELREKIEELKQLEIINNHLDDLNKKLTAEKKALSLLQKRLRKEERDVDNLEKTSVKSMFFKVLGNKEKQLDKERQEFLKVSLDYNSLVENIELLEFEAEVLQKKSQNTETLKQTIIILKEKRMDEISKSDDIAKRKALQHIINEWEKSIRYRKELIEAHNVGKQAKQALTQVRGHLKDARNWGNWDTISNNRTASYAKHSALDRAWRLFPKTQQLLNAFSLELEDIGQYIKFKIQHIEFNRFTDIILDSMIHDWVIQSKITKSLKSVIVTQESVESIMNELGNEVEKTEQEITEWISQKDELLVK